MININTSIFQLQKDILEHCVAKPPLQICKFCSLYTYSSHICGQCHQSMHSTLMPDRMQDGQMQPSGCLKRWGFSTLYHGESYSTQKDSHKNAIFQSDCIAQCNKAKQCFSSTCVSRSFRQTPQLFI